MNTRNEYPRPQQRRQEWFTLNGEWDFCFDDNDEGLLKKYPDGKTSFDKKINVPFAYQYPLSGIGDETSHEIMWYKREFEIADLKKNYLLCFNGVDYFCDVYLNGIHITNHEGGYTYFDADITKYVKKGKNIIVLRVYDPDWCDIPRGKQSWKNGKRFACWYLPSSGIWKSVWVECFNKDYASERTLYTDIDEGKVYGEISVKYGFADTLEVAVSRKDELRTQASFMFKNGKAKYALDMKNGSDVWKFSLWSPENPYLYDIEYKLLKDGKVLDSFTSRFGMRKISVDESGQICLNNCPYYQKLVLDQGYFGEGGLTAKSAEQIKDSIVTMKKMGFNGARKHQKIEDPYYYYYAEELGFLTWLEMPSGYEFTKREIRSLLSELCDVISQNCSFTSIITYVPLNESWGVDAIVSDKKQQEFAKSAYRLIKALDQTRLVCTNDGWENISDSDIVSIHDYCRGSDKYSPYYLDKNKVDAISPAGRKVMCDRNRYKNQPIIFSEYGGIAYDKDSRGGNWGYGDGAKTEEELLKRIEDLTANLKGTYFQGFCYTQFTDVQQEVNGLCDNELNPKFKTERLKEIFDSVK